MAELKTKPTDADVDAFLAAVPHERRRADALAVRAMMDRVTGLKPRLWGESLIGYGRYHYRTGSGHEGDWPITGFSPRKAALTVYIMNGFERYGDLLARLGKHKLGKSCLYINRLDAIDRNVLEELVTQSVARIREKYGVASGEG